jgi:general secretion pathway protein M
MSAIREQWQQLWAPWQARWQGLSGREQIILLVGGVLLTVGLGWAYLWQPLLAQRDKLNKQVPLLRTQLAKAKADVALIKSSAGQRPVSQSVATDLAGQITEAATQARLQDKLGLLPPAKGDQISLQLKDWPFNEWLTLSRQLELGGVRIRQLEATATGSSGQVTLRVVLARS